jgi:hypothetical protein
MKVEASGPIRDVNLGGHTSNRDNSFGGIDAIGSRAGIHFNWHGTRRRLKIDVVEARPSQFACRVLNARASRGTESKQCKNRTGTIANRRSHSATAEMPRERLFILVIAVHREVLDTGLTLRIIHPLVSIVAEKACK